MLDARRRAIRGCLAAALITLVALPAAAAGQSDVSREQAQQLAAAARDDPAALEQLRAIGTIDGRPANTEAALLGADPSELEDRLGTLERALSAPGSDSDAAGARADAAQIVAGFPEDQQPAAPPETASPGGDGGSLGFDIGSLWIPLLVIAVIAGALLALRLARNRESGARLEAEAAQEAPPEPVSELEVRAREAEGSGDYEAALRLRYGIALRTLQDQGAVPAGPSLTPARLSRELGHPRAGKLVGTFERVVYGRRQAAAEDAQEAREGWPLVVSESGASARARGSDTAVAEADAGRQAR
jgi:hypothetical protein